MCILKVFLDPDLANLGAFEKLWMFSFQNTEEIWKFDGWIKSYGLEKRAYVFCTIF